MAASRQAELQLYRPDAGPAAAHPRPLQHHAANGVLEGWLILVAPRGLQRGQQETSEEHVTTEPALALAMQICKGHERNQLTFRGVPPGPVPTTPAHTCTAARNGCSYRNDPFAKAVSGRGGIDTPLPFMPHQKCCPAAQPHLAAHVHHVRRLQRDVEGGAQLQFPSGNRVRVRR